MTNATIVRSRLTAYQREPGRDVGLGRRRRPRLEAARLRRALVASRTNVIALLARPMNCLKSSPKRITSVALGGGQLRPDRTWLSWRGLCARHDAHRQARTRRRAADGRANGDAQSLGCTFWLSIIIQRVRRDTLIDFFDDLAAARGEFLVHDDGFRSRTLQLRGGRPRGARVRRAPARRGPAQGRQGRLLLREPPRMDRRLLGLPARRRHRRPDRLPRRRPTFSRASPDRRRRSSCSSGRMCRRSPTRPARRRGGCTSSTGRRSTAAAGTRRRR